jgi:hypothetical protein
MVSPAIVVGYVERFLAIQARHHRHDADTTTVVVRGRPGFLVVFMDVVSDDDLFCESFFVV